MEILNSRRITGPSLFTEFPGAMLEVQVPNTIQDEAIQAWDVSVRRYLNVVGWGQSTTLTRKYENGISLYFSAPIDALYAACEINEAAWELALWELNSEGAISFPEEVNRLKKEIEDELNPNILALKEASIRNKVRFFQSDDIVSVGTGKGSHSFDVNKIPAPEKIDWKEVNDIPVILITGTNGKSTTVRLMETLLAEAGFSPGASSTDGLRVNLETVEVGDYSGPEGARATLRTKGISSAVLEVARGGILRRGMPVENVQAAIITNVAEDHFGEWGVASLPDMIATKFVVRKVLAKNGLLVVNADDAGCVKFAESLSETLCWFSLESNNPVIKQHCDAGGRSCYVEGDQIIFSSASNKEIIAEVKDFPITVSGMARYNIQNCLGAILLAKALDINTVEIKKGLSSFGGSFNENPGRGNFFEKDGITIVFDFAHNPHGLNAIVDLVSQFEAKRKLVLMGQAGDRSDNDIFSLVKAAANLNPDKVVACEILKFLRGRETEEVPELIKSYFIEQGIEENSIIIKEDILSGVNSALEWAESGDLLLLLALDQKEECIEAIQTFCAD
jgi:UDP-N-acetylmuramyl tripeptide synthase